MRNLRVLLSVAAVLAGGISLPGAVAQSDQVVNDSLASRFRRDLAELTSPEVNARNARRRQMQQKGYADVLFHALRGDGLWGAIAALRNRAQLEYSLPRTPIVIYIPIRQEKPRDPSLPGFTGAPSPPLAVPLQEEKAFPADPWSTKK